MPRALMHMMRDFESSVSGVVDMSSVFSRLVTEAFSRLADVSTIAISADKQINHVFSRVHATL